MVLLLSLSACETDSLLLRKSVTRFELPESMGKHNVSFNLQSAGGYEIEILNTDGVDAPDADSPVINAVQSNYGFSTFLGINDKLAVGLLLEPKDNTGIWSDIVPMVKLKYQMLGPTQYQAGIGDMSLAVTTAIGYTEDVDRTDAFIRHHLRLFTTDAGLLGGIRLTPATLLYGGPFITQYFFNSTYDYNDGTTSARTKQKGKAQIIGTHLGLAFFITKDWNVKGEVLRSKLHWEDIHMSDMQVGIRATKLIR